MEFSHYSVMLKETIEELKVKSDGIYVDGTLGGGGHAYEVCKRLSDAGHFYGIDQDAAAIAAAFIRDIISIIYFLIFYHPPCLSGLKVNSSRPL